MPGPALSPKEHLILAGERLFARHGLDGASLRQIGFAAGNANKSAVHYHFGSKEALIQAIVEYRMARLHARRLALVADHGTDDVQSWLLCQVTPLMEQAEVPGNHYMSFLAQLWQFGPRPMPLLAEPMNAEVSEFHARLPALLPDLAEPLRTHRIGQVRMLLVHAAADRERLNERGASVFPLAVAIRDLVDGMAAYLQALPSVPGRPGGDLDGTPGCAASVAVAESFPLL